MHSTFAALFNQSINYISCPWDPSGGSTDNIFNNVGSILGPAGGWKMEKDESNDIVQCLTAFSAQLSLQMLMSVTMSTSADASVYAAD